MARQVLPMRWPRWRRQAAASNLPTPRRSASHSKIRPMIRHGTTGRTCAWPANPLGHANGATARPASGWRDLPLAAALAAMPRVSRPTSTMLSRASSKRGPVSSILYVVARLVESNFYARRRIGPAHLTILRRAGWRPFSPTRRQMAITAGTVASGNSIWACFGVLPGWATPCCGGSIDPCPMCWSGNKPQAWPRQLGFFGAKLFAVHAFQHAFDANDAAALPTFEGLRLGQPHEPAATWAWHKLIGTDGGNAYCLGFATGTQSR